MIWKVLGDGRGCFDVEAVAEAASPAEVASPEKASCFLPLPLEVAIGTEEDEEEAVTGAGVAAALLDCFFFCGWPLTSPSRSTAFPLPLIDVEGASSYSTSTRAFFIGGGRYLSFLAERAGRLEPGGYAGLGVEPDALGPEDGLEPEETGALRLGAMAW